MPPQSFEIIHPTPGSIPGNTQNTIKITINIDDKHAGDLMQFIAALSAKPVDPAPGHSELNLDGMIDAAQAKAEALTEKLDAAIARAEDPTMRDLPLPDGLFFPELPEGKTRWIYRGNDFKDSIPAGDRCIRWFNDECSEWVWTGIFNIEGVHHIEAVTENEPAVADDPEIQKAIAALPDGFVFASKSMLLVPSDKPTTDLMRWGGGFWSDGGNGWYGSAEGPWAVRAGSPIAIANCIF